MKTGAIVLAHQQSLRKRALDFWNQRQGLKAAWQVFLVVVTLGSLFSSIHSSIAVGNLASKIIVTDRTRDVDRFGQTVNTHGDTYALPNEQTRHKLLHDFVSCWFNVEPNYQQMQAQSSDCLTMIQSDTATATCRSTIVKYWQEHSPLRPDGTWANQLANPLYVHVTSYVRQHVFSNGDEQWNVELTLANGLMTTAQPDSLITTSITLTPRAAASDADPFGLLASQCSWDVVR